MSFLVFSTEEVGKRSIQLPAKSHMAETQGFCRLGFVESYSDVQ